MDTSPSEIREGRKTLLRDQVFRISNVSRFWPHDRNEQMNLVLLVIILFLGTFVRIINQNWAEFKGDEAAWVEMADRILQGGLPVRGDSTAALPGLEWHGGPLIGYLTAFSFLLIGRHPISGSLLIGIVNSIGIYFTYLVGKKLYDTRVGIIAAALVATTPWAVFYSRKLWPPVILPFIISIYLYVLYSSSENGYRRMYFLVGLTAGLSLQLHMTGLILIPLSALFIIFCGIKRRHSFYAIPGWILGYLPLLLDDISNNWVLMKTYWELIINPHARPEYYGGPSEHRANTIRLLSELLIGDGLKHKFGPNFSEFWINTLQPVIILGFLLIGVVYIVYRCILPFFESNNLRESLKLIRKLPKNDMLLFITFGGFLYFHLFGFTGQGRGIQYHHYLINLAYPIGCLVVARGALLMYEFLRAHFTAEFRPLRFRLEYLAFILVILVVFQNLVSVYTGFQFIQDTGGEGEFGVTLQNKIDVVNAVIDNSSGLYFVLGIFGRDFRAYAYLFDLFDPDDLNTTHSQVRRQSTEIEGNGIFYYIVERVNYGSQYNLFNRTHTRIFDRQGTAAFLVG